MPQQQWCGDWTEVKLGALREYLRMYAAALRNQKFGRIYIDAFAGSGYRSQPTRLDHHTSLFAEFGDADRFAKGSPLIALEVDPPFTGYVFVEKASRKFAELKQAIQADFPDKVAQMQFVNEDANVSIPALCDTIDWKRNRAVLFLDPYGMQVNWATVSAVARTKAIDTWYLFPAFIGLGRMLPRTGVMPQEWEITLDRCLGDSGWRQEFYATATATDLFADSQEVRERSFDHKSVERYLRCRLETIFASVAPRALALCNRNRVPMYLLFFACNGNEKARQLALKFANHILKE